MPEGWTEVAYAGHGWGLTRTTRAGGGAISVYAEQLGGAGVVSANVYRTASGDLLRPCEMPAETVLAFLRGWRDARRRDEREETGADTTVER